MWEAVLVAVLIAVTTAVATTLIAEGVREIHRRVDRRNRVADWALRGFPARTGLIGRFFVIENTGDADAIDVRVTISGDAEFEVNAGAELNLVRPRDTFLLLVHKPGTASVNIAWTDRQGKSHGPVRRALTPE